MVFMFSQNAASSRKLISNAAKLKIMVVDAHSIAAWSTPMDPEYEGYFISFLTPDNVMGSKAMCVSVFKQIGGKGKVINLNGIPGNMSNDERTLGVDLALKEFPDIKMVARQNGTENRTGAQPIIENLLTAHPDVDAVVCHNDDSAIAVLNALRDRGMTKVKVGGIDAIQEFLDAMQKGPNAAATTAIHGGWLGGQAVVRLFDALNGVKIEPAERFMYQDSLVIDTPEAAKAYTESIYKAQKLPFDWRKASRFLNPNDWDPQNGLLPIDPNDYYGRVNLPKLQGFTEVPKELQDTAARGKIADLYKGRFKGGPIMDAVKLTTAKKTVLGFS
jgi:ribose transport system substrate-binding protein